MIKNEQTIDETKEYLGMWVTADGYIRHELLPGNRYDEARGNRKSAYQGNYIITGNHIDYQDDTATVYIKTFAKGISMPNAFSPNGDGQNDHSYVIGRLDIMKVRNLSVFNRVGNKVFEAVNTPANDRSFGWDGYVNGKRAGIGTYVYFAAVEYKDGSVQTIKGTVVVIQ